MPKEKGVVTLVPLVLIAVVVGVAFILHNYYPNLRPIDYKIKAEDIVTVISPPSGNCQDTALGCSYVLGVKCQGLAERQVTVKEKQPANIIGGVLFTTGTYGATFYSDESPSIVSTTINNGFQTFELAWSGNKGWGTGVLGSGYKSAMCAYSVAARWIHDNRMLTPDIMCATGNSGGGFQISYGLAAYGLEDIMDMAVVTGGPPTSRLDIGCFGTDPTYQDGTWPADVGGRQITDSIMNWPGYCNLANPPTSTAIQQSKDTSIVIPQDASPTEIRDYEYPNSKLNFVEGGNDPLRFNGKIYHDVITTLKSYQELAGVSHAVHKSNTGGTAIKNLIRDECKAWVGGQGGPTPTPTPVGPTNTPTPTLTPTPTNTPTPTPIGGSCDPGTLGSSLSAYWKMDEASGTTVADSSGNGKNGTKLSATEPNPIAAIISNGNDFDGVNDRINVSSPALPTGDFTYSAWVNADTLTAIRTIYSSADGAATNEIGIKVATTGKVQVFSANTLRLTTTTVLTAGTWYHLGVVRSGSTITAYINGVADATTGNDSTVLNFGSCGLVFGTRQTATCGNSNTEPMDGKVDEAGIWSRALSDSEVSALYNSGAACRPNGI